MKIFEIKDVYNWVGNWREYYLFGIKIHTKLVCLYRYK